MLSRADPYPNSLSIQICNELEYLKITYTRTFGKGQQNLLHRLSHSHSRWAAEALLEILNATESHWEMVIKFSKIQTNYEYI